MNQEVYQLSGEDKLFINRIRGLMILRVVLMHLGLGWIFLPYSGYLGAFFPMLFLVSGVVSYYSYLRTKSLKAFIVRRLTRLYVTYFIISGLALAVVFTFFSKWGFDLYKILDWLLINQAKEDRPYSFNHVWYLRALVVITIICLPFFYLSKRNIHFLLLPILCSICLQALQEKYGIGQLFQIQPGELNTFNTYLPLSFMGSYCFGAWIYATGYFKSIKLHVCLGLLAIGYLINCHVFKGYAWGFAEHSYYQDIYYLAWGILGIVCIFLVRKPFTMALDKVSVLNKTLLFFNAHAFTIYLIHTLFIDLSESIFHLNGGILKISLVVSATLLVSVPISFVCKAVTERLISVFSGGKKQVEA